MNQCHKSWEPALTNFMATVCVIKPAKQLLQTLFASHSRIGTFVYCRIHISNFTEFGGAILLTQLLQILCFFIAHPTYLPDLKKWKWGCTIQFLSNNLLILLSNPTKLAAAIYLPINILHVIDTTRKYSSKKTCYMCACVYSNMLPVVWVCNHTITANLCIIMCASQCLIICVSVPWWLPNCPLWSV